MRFVLAVVLLGGCCPVPGASEPPPEEWGVSQELKLSPKGLYSQPSLIGEDIPEGALVTADNVVINREGIIEPRRGVSAYATMTANRLFSYQDRLISHSSTGTVSYDNGAGTFTALTGTFAPPSATTAKTRSAQAAQDLFLTTSAGVYRMDAYNSIPLLSGAVKATGFERDQRVFTSTAGNMSLTSNVVTVNTSAAHGFYVGQVVTMTSATEGAHYVNGNHVVLSVPTSTRFTYAETAADDAANANTHTFMPAALAAAVFGVAGGGFLSDGNQVAYRVVFNCPDANNTEKPGAASPRTVITNASGTPGWVTAEARNTIVRVFVPSGITTSHIVRLYRSKQVASSTEPDDDMQLVYESLVKTTEIANGWMDITDVVPDVLRGATGYFAPSQEGMAQNNERPPLAKDIASFGGSMHYANTTGLQRFVFSILAVGGSGGIQDGDVIGFVNNYEAKTTPTTTNHFKLETSGTTAANIRNTALNLCAAINRDTVITDVRAYYISLPTDPPGKILIEARAPGASAFYPYMATSAPGEGIRTALNPVFNAVQTVLDLSRTSNVVTATNASGHNFLVGEQVTLLSPSGTFGAGPHTVTSVTTTTFTYTETAANATLSAASFRGYVRLSSTAEANPSRVYNSKPNLNEAVPLLNYNDLGTKDGEILRIVALRESMFAFKEDGLFRGVGSNGQFTWRLFDPNVILVAPDSVVTLGNQIYALTTQGVVAVSDTGSEIVSRPIERTLTKLMTADLASVQQVTFGIGYESEHTYELRTISAASETTCTQAFIYNTLTGAWVRDTIESKTGVIHSDGKRYLGGATQILKERKAFKYSDYSDADLSVTIVDPPAATVTLVSASGVAAGDTLTSLGYYARITAVNGNTLSFSTEDLASISEMLIGGATVHKAISSTVQWAPITAKSPAASKMWQETNLLLGNGFFATATESHSTELIPTFEATTIDGITTVGQWTSAQSTAAISAQVVTERPFNLRMLVPQEMRRSTQLNLKFAVAHTWAAWNISGLSVLFRPGSERTSR